MKLNYISLLAAAAIFVIPTVASANGDNNSQAGTPATSSDAGTPAASSDVGTPPAAATTGAPTTTPGMVPPPAPGAAPAEGGPTEGTPADADSANDSQDNGGNSSSN